VRRHDGHTKDGCVDPKGNDGGQAHGFVWVIGSAKGHDDSVVHGFAKGCDTHKGCDGDLWRAYKRTRVLNQGRQVW
jgi:hypothetical protein